MVDAQRIQQVSDEIARRFHPERIILFGSYAYGTPTDARDIEKAIEIKQAIGVYVATDLFVYDPM